MPCIIPIYVLLQNCLISIPLSFFSKPNINLPLNCLGLACYDNIYLISTLSVVVETLFFLSKVNVLFV